MIDLVLRAAVVGVVLVAAFVAVAWWQRRRGPDRVGLAPGVTIVVGPGCALCGPAETAIRALAGRIPVRVVDHDSPAAQPWRVRSLPTVFVAGEDGRAVLRRSGRAAVDDAGSIVTVAGQALQARFTPKQSSR